MAENRLDAMAVSVDGRNLDPAVFDCISMVRVEESVQLPDVFEVRVDDPHFELFDRNVFDMGALVEIAFRSEGDMTVVTTGEVTTLTIEQGPTGRHEIVLRGFDLAHRLRRGPKSRTFAQMTDADIASQIGAEYGLATDVDATREIHEHVIQPNQTDMEFLKARAERIGFDVWVSADTLHFKERPRSDGAVPKLTWGENLHKFKVRFSSTDRCDRVTVRGWDPVAKREIVGRAEEGDAGTDAPAAGELAAAASRAFGAIERVAGHFPVTSQAEADAMARSLLLKASGGEVVVRGEAVGDPRLTAGADVEIDQVGSRLTGRYLITSVEHIYGSGSPYVTRFVCGAKDPSSLVDLVSGNGKKGWGSLVQAVVTRIDDPERLGRVKVKFVDLAETESGWASVLSPGAGADRGLQLIPEVGDNVLVGFEHDDKRRPIVLGGFWNQSDPLPSPDAESGGEVTTRLLRSRNGHHLTLTDEAEGKLTLGLGDADCSLEFTEAESVLKVARKLVIEGMDVEISGTSKLVLSAPNVEINGDASVKVTGGVIQLN